MSHTPERFAPNPEPLTVHELRRRNHLGLSILNWREGDPTRALALTRLALHGATLDELVALESIDLAPTIGPTQAA